MHDANPFRRSLRSVAALALLSIAAACKDSTGSDPEPQIASVRVTVGAQVVTISETGQQTGTLTVPRASTPVTVAWLRADGSADPVVNSQDFEVRMIAQGSTGISFTPAGPFAGTLAATTSGQKTVRVQLYHLAEQHDEFGQNLTLTVQ
jgi:hypothetical protein